MGVEGEEGEGERRTLQKQTQNHVTPTSHISLSSTFGCVHGGSFRCLTCQLSRAGCMSDCANKFRGAIGRSFQLSSRIFCEFLFVFFVIRINNVNSSQSPSIVELRLLFCPFLFFSILSGFPNFRPYFRPCMIWSRSRLNFCQSPPGPYIPLGRFLFQFCESFPRI